MNAEGIRKSTMGSLAALAAYAPAAGEVMRRVGVRRRRSRIAERAAWAGAGLALGSIAALLLAPHQGSETRRRIRERAERVKATAQREVKARAAAYTAPEGAPSEMA